MGLLSMAKVNLTPTEDHEQEVVATYLRRNKILFFAVPNGGMRNVIVAMKLKRQGVSPGVPDLVIPVPVAPYHGLFLELKRVKGSVVSPAQKEWLYQLRKNMYYAHVAYGAEDAIAIIEAYLRGIPEGVASRDCK